MSDSDEDNKFYTMCSLIARSAFRNGRKNPTDTAGMDERFKEWYLSQDGDADDLILQLYRQLKAHKKKGSKKKKRTKKRTKKKLAKSGKFNTTRERKRMKLDVRRKTIHKPGKTHDFMKDMINELEYDAKIFATDIERETLTLDHAGEYSAKRQKEIKKVIADLKRSLDKTRDNLKMLLGTQGEHPDAGRLSDDSPDSPA